MDPNTLSHDKLVAHRCPTGISGLDSVLQGGLIAHQLYLVEGNPGSGKTTLSLQFLIEGARQGERCLYITLSETEKELRAGASTHGWDLAGIDIVELVANEETLEREAQVTMYHPSEVELGDLTKSVLEAVEKVRPSRVVFDSLSELKLLSQSSLRYRRQVLALKQFLIGNKCTVLMLDDKTTEDADLQLQSIAHGVISLTQTFPAYGKERRKLNVIKMRGARFHGGHHDFSIETGGVNVFPRLVAAGQSIDFPQNQVSSGVENLDRLLGGGVERGTSTLLLGPAGSGKSTIAVSYAANAAKGGKHAALFLFDEGIATLRLRCQAIGIELLEGTGPGHIAIHTVDPAEVSPGEFASMVRNAVEQDGAEIVVIDSLNGYLNAMPDEPFLTAQLHELLSFLGRRGVTTFMVVAQHGMVVGFNAPSPIDTSYLADCVVLHRFYEYRGQVKKAISIVKKRSGKHEETIRGLYFDESGIHLTEPLSQLRGVLSGVPIELPDSSSN